MLTIWVKAGVLITTLNVTLLIIVHYCLNCTLLLRDRGQTSSNSQTQNWNIVSKAAWAISTCRKSDFLIILHLDLFGPLEILAWSGIFMIGSLALNLLMQWAQWDAHHRDPLVQKGWWAESGTESYQIRFCSLMTEVQIFKKLGAESKTTERKFSVKFLHNFKTFYAQVLDVKLFLLIILR